MALDGLPAATPAARPPPDGRLAEARRAHSLSPSARRAAQAWLSRGLVRGEAAARDLHNLSLADALELCLLYRGEPERYERAAARWIARLIAERPGVRLAEVELAAAGFREAVLSDRGVVLLRECLAASTRAADRTMR